MDTCICAFSAIFIFCSLTIEHKQFTKRFLQYQCIALKVERGTITVTRWSDLLGYIVQLLTNIVHKHESIQIRLLLLCLPVIAAMHSCRLAKELFESRTQIGCEEVISAFTSYREVALENHELN